jgi:hypothetical protein
MPESDSFFEREMAVIAAKFRPQELYCRENELLQAAEFCEFSAASCIADARLLKYFILFQGQREPDVM